MAVLSFVFFLGSFIFYLIWQSFLFFLLSTSFLIVQLFTIVGWWMQRRSGVSIYENGLQYRKNIIFWTDIAHIRLERHGDLSLGLVDESEVKIPAATESLNRIASYIDARKGASDR